MTKSTVLALIVALAMSSSALAGAISDDQIAALKTGVTTYDDVVGQFGKPNTMETNSDGTRTIGYIVTRTHVKAATWVPIVGLFAGGATGESSKDEFQFDAQGKLTKISTSSTEIDCRTFAGCGTKR